MDEANTAQAEQARRGAKESERAREQIAHRIAIARRDVYNANLRAEQCELRAEHAEATARSAEERAAQAEQARVERDQARVERDQALRERDQARVERDQALRERDAILLSTTWRATCLLRMIAHRLPPGVQRGTKLAWWSLTLKLPRALREWRASHSTARGRSERL